MEPVTITSSLKQRALCPGDLGATITCITVGRELAWQIGTNAFSFFEESRIGTLEEGNGFSVNLQRRVATSTPGEFIFYSVLHISEYRSSELIRISCDNGRTSTSQFYEFLPVVSGNFNL